MGPKALLGLCMLTTVFGVGQAAAELKYSDLVVEYRVQSDPTKNTEPCLQQTLDTLRARLREVNVDKAVVKEGEEPHTIVVTIPGREKYKYALAEQLAKQGELQVFLAWMVFQKQPPFFDELRVQGSATGYHLVRSSPDGPRSVADLVLLLSSKDLGRSNAIIVLDNGKPYVRLDVDQQRWQELRSKLPRWSQMNVLFVLDGRIAWAPQLQVTDEDVQEWDYLYFSAGSAFMGEMIAMRLNHPLPCSLAVAGLELAK